jgi:hypothetical protein
MGGVGWPRAPPELEGELAPLHLCAYLGHNTVGTARDHLLDGQDAIWQELC